MKFFHLFVCIVLVGFLIWLNRMFVPADAAVYGGLSWIGWVSIALVGVGIGFLAIFKDSTRALLVFLKPATKRPFRRQISELFRAPN